MTATGGQNFGWTSDPEKQSHVSLQGLPDRRLSESRFNCKNRKSMNLVNIILLWDLPRIVRNSCLRFSRPLRATCWDLTVHRDPNLTNTFKRWSHEMWSASLALPAHLCNRAARSMYVGESGALPASHVSVSGHLVENIHKYDRVERCVSDLGFPCPLARELCRSCERRLWCARQWNWYIPWDSLDKGRGKIWRKRSLLAPTDVWFNDGLANKVWWYLCRCNLGMTSVPAHKWSWPLVNFYSMTTSLMKSMDTVLRIQNETARTAFYHRKWIGMRRLQRWSQ